MLLMSQYQCPLPLQRLKIRAKGVGTEKTPLEILRKSEPAQFDNDYVMSSNKDKFGQFGKIKTKEGWIATQKLNNLRTSEGLNMHHECSDDFLKSPGSLIAKLLLFKGFTMELLEEKMADSHRHYTEQLQAVHSALCRRPKLHLIPHLKKLKKAYKRKLEYPSVPVRINTTVRLRDREQFFIKTIYLNGVGENGVELTKESLEDIMLQIAGVLNPITI